MTTTHYGDVEIRRGWAGNLPQPYFKRASLQSARSLAHLTADTDHAANATRALLRRSALISKTHSGTEPYWRMHSTRIRAILIHMIVENAKSSECPSTVSTTRTTAERVFARKRLIGVCMHNFADKDTPSARQSAALCAQRVTQTAFIVSNCFGII